MRIYILLTVSLIVNNLNSQFQDGNEQVQRILGVARNSNKYENHNVPITRGESLPVTYSFRKYTHFVGDQGRYGTCVGWTTTVNRQYKVDQT